jgi:hypothetical protein
MKTTEANPTRTARASKSEPKADTVSASASKPTRAFDRRTDLTPGEAKVVREFVEEGKAIEKSFSKQLLALGTKVKAIFASKTRGIPVFFEGRPYMTFDIFVEANFPICARTMRRWLAKAGETDQRFANKSKPKPLPESASEDKPEPEVAAETELPKMEAEKEARIRSAVGYPRGKPLPRNLLKAYDAGWRQGYQDALANTDKRRGLA